jgi:hypothetical protein
VESTERDALRREILEEVGALLREHLAGDEWARALVEVVRAPDGHPVVAGIDVEGIAGDEALVDAAFSGETASPVLPVLAKATEALCGLAGVELEDVRGGTFLRHAEGFRWLPGLVHMPSAALVRAWDDAVQKLQARNRELSERFGLSLYDRYDVDVQEETIAFSAAEGGRVAARATLIGTFTFASRTWGWGGYNRSVPEGVRMASARLVDDILEREMWELSTPVFTTDEATARSLSAFVCERTNGEGVHCSRTAGGLVFFLLREVRAVASS